MALLGRMPSWRAELGTFQALFAVAFAFFAIAVARAERYVHAPWAAVVVLIVAVAARIAVLPAPPTLSDDIFRYIWEGRVAAHGENPFRLAPSAPELERLRDGVVFPRVNHPELATIYPPLSIAGFALVAALSPTVWAMKLWILLHDLALVALLVLWMQRRGESVVRAAAYAWCPLVIVEFAGSGHNDPTALVWLVAALMLAETRPLGSALALAVGALTKLVPLLALPFLLRRWPWRARLLAGGVLAFGLAWFWHQTRGADSGLTAYGRVWRNNDLLFHYLERLAGDPDQARVLVVALMAAVTLFLLWRRAGCEIASRATLRATLIASPVAHPWYFAWPLALEPLGPSAPWLLLSLTCVLSYGLLAPPGEGRGFHLPLEWRWVEYGAPLLLAVALALRSRGRASASRVGASES